MPITPPPAPIPYTAIRIYEASPTITYIGRAAPGSLTSDPVWQIQRIDTSSGTVIEWADGLSDFDFIWDDRASLTYS